MPVAPTIALTLIAAFASLAFLAASAASPARRLAWRSPSASAALLLLLAFLANIMICGALSTPHARYQMRIVWLLPLAALTVGAGQLARRVGRRDDDPSSCPEATAS